MKHLGLMYAGDPISTIPYVGVNAGLVVVSAGDPSCRTSPNEQDQRHFSRFLFYPMLDPATPDDALRMTRFAFELSEQSELPVLMRLTTRVCHTRGAIPFGPLREAVGLRRMVGTALEAASSGGREGIESLYQESMAVFNQRDLPEPEVVVQPFWKPVAGDPGEIARLLGLVEHQEKLVERIAEGTRKISELRAALTQAVEEA